MEIRIRLKVSINGFIKGGIYPAITIDDNCCLACMERNDSEYGHNGYLNSEDSDKVCKWAKKMTQIYGQESLRYIDFCNVDIIYPNDLKIY